MSRPYGVRDTSTGSGASVTGRHTSAYNTTPSRIGIATLRSRMTSSSTSVVTAMSNPQASSSGAERLGEDFHVVAVGVEEVEAPARVVVDLARLLVHGIGPVA